MPKTRPERDVLTLMFNALNIPRLSQAVADGTVVETAGDQLGAYVNVASVRWDGAPMTYEGQDPQITLAQDFGLKLAEVLSGDGPNYFEVAGEPFMHTDCGPIAVTPELLRHWEWMLAVLTNETTARTLLDVVPAEYRQAGAEVAQRSWGTTFDETVEKVRKEWNL